MNLSLIEKEAMFQDLKEIKKTNAAIAETNKAIAVLLKGMNDFFRSMEELETKDDGSYQKELSKGYGPKI